MGSWKVIKKIRIFDHKSCNNDLDGDWIERSDNLLDHNWYAINYVLPNGGFIIIGGLNAFCYEWCDLSAHFMGAFMW